MKALFIILSSIENSSYIFTAILLFHTALIIKKVRKGSVGVTYSEGCSAEDRQLVSTMFSRFIIIIHQQYAHFCHKKQPKHFIPVWRVAQKSPKNFKMLLRPWRALVRPISIRYSARFDLIVLVGAGCLS